MKLLTELALRRSSVTVLIIILLLIGGVFTYRSLQVELFPEIEFPLVTVSTFYPSANPEAVDRDVTAPIEAAISGVNGIDTIRSVSSENRSLVLAEFEFGVDMEEAERTISGNVGRVAFPDGIQEPIVGRIDPNAFPVLQVSLLGDLEMTELQRLMDSLVLPAVVGIDGVFNVQVTGRTEPRVVVTLDPERLAEHELSRAQVSRVLSESNVALPAGAVSAGGQIVPVRASSGYGSVEEIRSLVVGLSGRPGDPAAAPVLLSEVADVTETDGIPTSISRTNGKPSLGLNIIKEPDANTVDVTSAVIEALDDVSGLPPSVEIVLISNDGPAIQRQVDTLQREAILGFLFAVVVVFAFLISRRPTLARGMLLSLRPTIVIGLSIPLSIFTGIVLMGLNGMNLNFMTLGGLAISVGRVVDDSIVVLENVYRHIQRGQDRKRVVLEATVEVGPAIIASTLTTMVVFAPLAFLQGLVGAFFLPFALTVCFALAASLLVALTAVPVLGAALVRPGDIAESEEDEVTGEPQTWMQRAYIPALVWALRHKVLTLAAAAALTIGSLGLTLFIPVTLFPSGGERFLTIEAALPPGSSVEQTFAQVGRVESVLQGLSDEGAVEVYQTTVGSPENSFGPGSGVGGLNQAQIFVRLSDDAPEDLADQLRNDLPVPDGGTISISELASGPPSSGLELSITGADYGAISGVTRQLVEELSTIEGVVNVSSDVTEARDQVEVDIDPAAAAALGLTAREVAFQVSQTLVGRAVTEVQIGGRPTSVVLRGGSVDGIEALRDLQIEGPAGSAPLGELAEVGVKEGPVTISRSDGRRSASISGALTAEDTRAIGLEVQAKVDAINLPPGVKVTTGGVFQQIAEGFEDIFLAMGTGVILVYLVMVASLGSLRNPFIIVMSLPLALIGVLASLAITGRTLGLPAMMGVLLLIGIVVTNAIVLIAFVQQLRERGMGVHEALVLGGRVRLRPILMTAFTTSFALLPLAAFAGSEGGIIGAELATVVIGGLISSSFLTLIVVPVVYTLMHESIPGLFGRLGRRSRVSPDLA